MLIDHLMLKNFGSYRDEVQLDFSGKKVVSITGLNETGKSTLLRAICFALYGKIPLKQDIHKVREIQLINDDAKGDLVVEVGLTFPDRSIVIQRGRTQSNTGYVHLDGRVLHSTDAQELIDETVRLAYPDFIGLSYFVQGDIHQLMLGDKGAYFMRWASSLRLWQRLSEALRGQVAALGGERDKNVTQRHLLSERAKSLAEYERSLAVAQRSLAQMRSAHSRLTEAVTELTARVKAAEQVARANTAITDLQDQLSTLTRHHTRLTSRLQVICREFKQVQSGTCPLLDVQCKRLERSGAKQRQALNLEMADLEEELTVNNSQQKEIKIRGRKLLKSIRQNGSQLKEDLVRVKRELDKANKDLEAAQVRTAKAQVLVDTAKQAKTEIKLCSKQINVLEKKISRSQFLQYMCGKSGIPSQIMETELALVESKCNWVLERLDYSKQIRFAAYKELASLEKVCPICGSEEWSKKACKGCGADQHHKRKDEPSVTVWDGTRERPFALESGGGQTLQSFAVRLAGSLFVASMLGINLRMVMLDEVFAHLDADNRQKLMSLVIDRLGSEFGLEQQLVVSHHEDIIGSVDHMLVVSKEHGSSVARWV